MAEVRSKLGRGFWTLRGSYKEPRQENRGWGSVRCGWGRYGFGVVSTGSSDVIGDLTREREVSTREDR